MTGKKQVPRCRKKGTAVERKAVFEKKHPGRFPSGVFVFKDRAEGVKGGIMPPLPPEAHLII